jgi:hypothetical protein
MTQIIHFFQGGTLMYKKVFALIVLFVLLMLACSNRVIDTTETQAPSTNIIFQDDFSNPNSGWEVGDYGSGSVGYENGYYFVIGTGAGVNMYGAAGKSFGDVIVSVDATAVQGPSNDNNGYGVICRKDPDPSSDNGYYLRISADGYYSIAKADENGFTDLVAWTESSTVRQGTKSNSIVASCIGNTLKLEVNGVVLAQATDSTYSTGDVALMAVTYEESSTTKVQFDNLVVRKP